MSTLRSESANVTVDIEMWSYGAVSKSFSGHSKIKTTAGQM